MKFDVVKICAGLIIVLALLTFSSIGADTTWRHSGFEQWGYDINSAGLNIWNGTQNNADYTYLIYKSGSTIYAIDGSTGAILMSGTDADVILQGAVDNATLGGKIFIKKGTYNMDTTINITTQGVVLQGEGSTTNTDAGAFVACTSFNWTGTGSPVFLFQAINNSTNNLKRVGMNDISINGNSAATIGLSIISVTGGQFERNFITGTTVAGIKLDVVHTLSEYTDTNHNVFVGNQIRQYGVGDGIGILLNRSYSTGSPAGNPSYNSFYQTGIFYYNSTGIEFGDCDNNVFYTTHMHRASGGIGTGIDFLGTYDGARDNLFYHLLPGKGGVIGQSGSNRNTIHGYDVGNSPPDPTGVNITTFKDDGTYISLINFAKSMDVQNGMYISGTLAPTGVTSTHWYLYQNTVGDLHLAKNGWDAPFVLNRTLGTLKLQLGYSGTGDENIYADSTGELVRGSLSRYGEAYIYDNAVATVIETADTPIALRQITTGCLNGWTFDAGSTGGITAYADGAGGKVTVSDAAHGLANDDIITIRGTTNYNGVFVVSDAATDTFKITDTWINDNGASDWDQGASLTAGANSAGSYNVNWQMSTAPDAAMTITWNVYINEVCQCKTTAERKYAINDLDTGSSSGVLTIAAGDVIWLAVKSDGTADITNKHGNFNLHRLC